MNNIYEIGDKTIDLNKLISVGKLRSDVSGQVSVELFFENNINQWSGSVAIMFRSGVNGMPLYHNSKGDWTEEDSNLWASAQSQVDKLIEAWGELTRLKT